MPLSKTQLSKDKLTHRENSSRSVHISSLLETRPDQIISIFWEKRIGVLPQSVGHFSFATGSPGLATQHAMTGELLALVILAEIDRIERFPTGLVPSIYANDG